MSNGGLPEVFRVVTTSSSGMLGLRETKLAPSRLSRLVALAMYSARPTSRTPSSKRQNMGKINANSTKFCPFWEVTLFAIQNLSINSPPLVDILRGTRRVGKIFIQHDGAAFKTNGRIQPAGEE